MPGLYHRSKWDVFNDKDEAIRLAIEKATHEWSVTCDEVYVVECVETVSPELIYDVDR